MVQQRRGSHAAGSTLTDARHAPGDRVQYRQRPHVATPLHAQWPTPGVTQRPAITTMYQLHIMLYGVQQPVWRRVCVPATLTLVQLHRVLQVVMGWRERRAHQFCIDGKVYGPPDMTDDLHTTNERQVQLQQLVPGTPTHFLYLYDVQEPWQHDVEVEQVLRRSPHQLGLYCLDGAGGCPPAGVGGPQGYAAVLAALQNPKHPEHHLLRTWVGREVDAAAFALDTVNQRLLQLR